MPSPSTSDRLIAQYPPVISQAQVAEIFGMHVQSVRRLMRVKQFPFVNVSIGAEKKYRLADIVDYLENPPAAQQPKQKKRLGRPVGSKNRTTEPAAVSHA